MKKSTRTIYGAALAAAQRTKEPLAILPNSTLNEKFDVFKNELPGTDEMPLVAYLAIGLNGRVMELTANGLYKSTPREYEPSWASLLKHIPFIVRPVKEDLTASERANYRMRRVELHDGVQYACYYLRKQDLSAHPLRVEKRVVINGVVTSQAWTPSLSDLNPVPLSPNPNQVMTTGNDYLSVSKKVPVVFTPTEIQEIMNGCNIIYGSPDYANVSEMAVVSGIERTLVGDFNGTARDYVEVIYAQVCDFVKTFFSCPDSLDGATVNLDIGSNEPLLTLS